MEGQVYYQKGVGQLVRVVTLQGCDKADDCQAKCELVYSLKDAINRNRGSYRPFGINLQEWLDDKMVYEEAEKDGRFLESLSEYEGHQCFDELVRDATFRLSRLDPHSDVQDRLFLRVQEPNTIETGAVLTFSGSDQSNVWKELVQLRSALLES